MKEDEISFEGSEFENNYTVLEEHGIYWLMCVLQNLINNLNSEISSEVIEEIQSLPIEEASSRAERHVRDFIVLHELHGLLNRTVAKFNILHSGRHIS